ncbi:MAG: YceI family protein [Cyclobacteriaceae bacterium]|nr:YceI family protein [Cyclobacteriaceae bacterium]
MRTILFVLICAGAMQAQPRPEIIPLSDFGTSGLWKSQPDLSSATRWELNLKESKLLWSGRPIAGNGHEGTLQFLSGSITTSATGQINQGDLVVDMHSLKNTDMQPDDGGIDLETHLKGDDFFSVAKYPQAKFKITAIANDKAVGRVKVFGLLTIKGITNAVEFSGTLNTQKESILVKGELTIDRTQWGVNHQSNSVFKSLKDGVISDEVKITLDLKFFVGC